MKKILVPCDFSSPSVEALKFAATLARRNNGEVLLLHGVALPALYDSSAVLEFERRYMEDRQAQANRKSVKLMKRWCKGLKTKILVEFGKTVNVIESAIKSSGADLVVMGTHGASGVKEYSIGSNTERVVRRSKVPVIALRKAVSQVKSLVFPTTPNGDQKKIVGMVKELQRLFNAKLYVLFVNTPGLFLRDSDIIPSLERFANRYGLKSYSLNICNDTDEAEGIIHFTSKLTSPLVAMKTRGRLGLMHVANGSIAEDVVNHIKCPVWTLKTK
jgi:nucleotide-binding universal stress UspA family protein